MIKLKIELKKCVGCNGEMGSLKVYDNPDSSGSYIKCTGCDTKWEIDYPSKGNSSYNLTLTKEMCRMWNELPRKKRKSSSVRT